MFLFCENWINYLKYHAGFCNNCICLNLIVCSLTIGFYTIENTCIFLCRNIYYLQKKCNIVQKDPTHDDWIACRLIQYMLGFGRVSYIIIITINISCNTGEKNLSGFIFKSIQFLSFLQKLYANSIEFNYCHSRFEASS